MEKLIIGAAASSGIALIAWSARRIKNKRYAVADRMIHEDARDTLKAYIVRSYVMAGSPSMTRPRRNR